MRVVDVFEKLRPSDNFKLTMDQVAGRVVKAGAGGVGMDLDIDFN
jgi:hypothetical protein